MSDVISRKDAINAPLKLTYDGMEWIPTYHIEELPSAEPERKKGKWIRITQGAMPEKYICPFCHREVENYGVEELLPIRYPFCHCGADMRGEQDG